MLFRSAGKFAGGYLKREGRPTTREILTCRLTDRPIRPLFPDGFYDEVQIQASVLASDGENDPDVLSTMGASAALMIAPAPFNGPCASVRRSVMIADGADGADGNTNWTRFVRVVVQRRFPDSISVRLTDRRAIAVVVGPTRGVVVGEGGVIIADAASGFSSLVVAVCASIIICA